MLSRLIVIISSVATGLLILLLLSRTSSVPKRFQAFTPDPGAHTFSVDPHLDAKLARAETLWQQAVKDRGVMAKNMGYGREFPDEYVNPYNVWDFARPSFFCPHDLERVGKLGDGGKVVCGMTCYERESPGPSSEWNEAQDLIVYSFGVSKDSSFEAALLKRTNARIWGYDYSVNSWAKEISGDQYARAHFNKVGISKKTDREHKPPMSTIQDLMNDNGHTYIDLVKMDIEGYEFDAMASLIESVLEDSPDGGATLPFGQLLVEIHFMEEPPDATIPRDLNSWMKWWSSLEDLGLRPVNNEDNWVGDVIYGKPRFMEYTLINALDRERNKLLWA